MANFTTAIEHVVVLMLENRSFDHLFGYWPGAEGLAAGDFVNLVDPSKPMSAQNPALKAGDGATFATEKGQGPGHSIGATNTQLFGSSDGPPDGQAPSMNGFAQSYRNELLHDRVGRPTADDISLVMQSFRPQRLPAISELARQFVLCDHWHAEVPGPTMPNRLYMHAATSAGYAHNDWKHVFDLVTIYEQLGNAGLTWGVYYSDDNEVAKFSRINRNPDPFRIFEDRFALDAASGRLPHYSFVIPRFASGAGASEPVNSMHAPQDVRPGDRLVADVYGALAGNAALWKKTLLVVTFDEHGGFFDHVPPPSASNPDGIDSPAPDDRASFAPSFGFDRLGLRVPTILASPWLPRGSVDKSPYRHTSVLATVRKLFGVEGHLTKRDRDAPTFESLLLASPRDETPVLLSPPPLALETLAAVSLTGANHPGTLPTDDTIDALVDGWRQITSPLPQPSTAIAAMRVTTPTQQDAHAYLRAQVQRYLAFRATQPR